MRLNNCKEDETGDRYIDFEIIYWGELTNDIKNDFADIFSIGFGCLFVYGLCFSWMPHVIVYHILK